jgi:hypothetical protein
MRAFYQFIGNKSRKASKLSEKLKKKMPHFLIFNLLVIQSLDPDPESGSKVR